MLTAFVQKVACNPSQDSSIGSISTWYRGGPGFKSRQGREFFCENKKEYPQVRKTIVDAVHEKLPTEGLYVASMQWGTLIIITCYGMV